MDAKPMAVPTDTYVVKRRIVQAWDKAGTAPAKHAVKVVPSDWHWFRKVTEALVSERDAQAAENTALRAELAEERALCEKISEAWKSTLAERDALAARLAVPGEEELDKAQRVASVYRFEDADGEINLGTVIGALRARVAGLEGALADLQAGDYPRPLGERWRADGVPSTHDRCTHGSMMNEPCETCADAFISAALSPSAAQEARDAE